MPQGSAANKDNSCIWIRWKTKGEMARVAGHRLQPQKRLQGPFSCVRKTSKSSPETEARTEASPFSPQSTLLMLLAPVDEYINSHFQVNCIFFSLDCYLRNVGNVNRSSFVFPFWSSFFLSFSASWNWLYQGGLILVVCVPYVLKLWNNNIWSRSHHR